MTANDLPDDPNNDNDNIKNVSSEFLKKRFMNQNTIKKVKPGIKDYRLSPTEINNLLQEGEQLLKEEKKNAPKLKKKADAALRASKKNPYLIAREEVLEKILPCRRKEVLEIEEKGLPESRIYKEFIEQVIARGDELYG